MPSESNGAPWDLVVVGGGAAGLAAALTAARRGRRVLVLERTNECGKKLAITGGKKGNFTHNDEPDAMAAQFNTEPRVLLKLMRRFPWTRIAGFFAELGIRHIVDEDGCVWPNPKSAPRLRDELVKAIAQTGGVIQVRQHVKELAPGRETRWCVTTDDAEHSANSVLVGTGGMSYPATGSSGDGFGLAERLGLCVTPAYSALASLATRGEFRELAGITVGRTCVSVVVERSAAEPEVRATEMAPFLFARDYITGRAVINVSGFAGKALVQGKRVWVRVDWLPDLSAQGLADAIADERVRHGRTQVNNFIAARSAKRLANLLCDRAAVPRERTLAQLTREELERLTGAVKATEIEIVGTEPLARATVTGGGVALDEIDLSSFESRKHAGLYFAGEVLDVWGRSGGYNLHFAWASGIAAGESV